MSLNDPLNGDGRVFADKKLCLQLGKKIWISWLQLRDQSSIGRIHCLTSLPGGQITDVKSLNTESVGPGSQNP